MKKVLLVDDDKVLLDRVSLLLRKESLEVTTAGSVAEAITKMDCNEYDTIITDLSFGGHSIREGLKIIKHAVQHSPGSRIMVLSGHSSMDLIEVCYEFGISCFLSKPVDIRKMVSLV